MVGYMVDAWRERPDAPQLEVVDSRGPGRLDLAPIYFAACLARMVAGAMTDRPLLHIHLAGRGSTLRKLMVVRLGAALRLRMVLHLHDYDYAAFLDRLPGLAVRAVSAMFGRAQVVVTLGSADARMAVGRFGLDPQRVLVVPNAVPRPVGHRAAGQGSGPVRILFLGDPSRRKGVPDLLQALERLRRLEPGLDWTAVIAGGGRELDGLRQAAQRLGLEDQVSFPGWLTRDAVQVLLARADILTLPSYAEGLAMSVLEAMAYGLCVVCTPVGALAEAVEHDVCARVVTPGDVAALVRELAACVADPALRRRLGAAASARFAQRYDVERYPDAMRAAYALART